MAIHRRFGLVLPSVASALLLVVLAALAYSIVTQPAHTPAGIDPHFVLVGSGSGGTPATPSSATPPSKSFTISGRLTGLYPGRTAHLVLTVTNPLNQAIRVTDLTAAVSTVQQVATSGTCDGSSTNIHIGSFTGPSFLVDANSTLSSEPAYVPVTMPNSVVDACQGATFNLTYSGTAVQP